MINIMVYNVDAEAIEKIADDNDTTVAEVFEMFMDFAKEVKEENGLV